MVRAFTRGTHTRGLSSRRCVVVGQRCKEGLPVLVTFLPISAFARLLLARQERMVRGGCGVGREDQGGFGSAAENEDFVLAIMPVSQAELRPVPMQPDGGLPGWGRLGLYGRADDHPGDQPV